MRTWHRIEMCKFFQATKEEDSSTQGLALEKTAPGGLNIQVRCHYAGLKANQSPITLNALMTHDALKPQDVLEGRYEILGALGAGGFATVYRALQRSTGQRVAIKVLTAPARPDDPTRESGAVARFRRELTLIGALNHPNIVQLIDSGLTPAGEIFAVLELIEGDPLDEVLAREGPLSLPEARHVMFQVLDALSVAHAHGVIHRDLKPANIMLTRGGLRRNVKVLDFGIAAIVGTGLDAETTRLTQEGQSPGTPMYMAPELLREEPPTPRSDLYAWGLTFIEVLTAEAPLAGRSVGAIYLEHLSDAPIECPLAVTESPFAEIIRGAVEKSPLKRPQSALQLLQALDAFAMSGAHFANPPDPADAERRFEVVEGVARVHTKKPPVFEVLLSDAPLSASQPLEEITDTLRGARGLLRIKLRDDLGVLSPRRYASVPLRSMLSDGDAALGYLYRDDQTLPLGKRGGVTIDLIEDGWVCGQIDVESPRRPGVFAKGRFAARVID